MSFSVSVISLSIMPFMLMQMAGFPFLLALPLNLQGQWLWFRLCKTYFTDIPLHSHSPCLTHPILYYYPRDQIVVKCIYLSTPQLFTKDRNLNSGVWHIKPNIISLLYSLNYHTLAQTHSYRASFIFLEEISLFAFPLYVCLVFS